MGQTVSDALSEGSNSVHERKVKLSERELSNLFTKKCLAQLKQIETFAIKTNLQINDLNEDKLINEKEFDSLLNFPHNIEPEVKSFLFRFVLAAGEFPLLCEESSGTINVVKLLKIVVLLNKQRFNAVFGQGEQDYIELLLIILSLSRSLKIESTVHEKTNEKGRSDHPGEKSMDAVVVGNKLSWSSIDYYKGIAVGELFVTGKQLLLLFSFCLAISPLSINENKFAKLSQFEASFETKAWSSYEQSALALIRSIKFDIEPANLDSETFSVVEVVAIIKSTFPQILRPLENLFNTLLVMPSAVETPLLNSSIERTKLINNAKLAQLASFLPLDVCYSKMRKLYVGRESGFSMRSFESKVMKWNAPTILLVKGTRIDIEKKKLSKNADIFYNEEYPKFKPTDGSSAYGAGNEKLVFGVYIQQPWKSSNKETFGDAKTAIFQLEPQQQLFPASSFPSQKFVYFSTLNNGGIGIGCDLPLNKTGNKRFQPGNVSLLMDGGLEYCVFRHLGPGGSFATGSAYADSYPAYEDRFVISDLEVYGVGSDKEIQEQIKQWEWEKKEAEARQRVNINNLGEERAFLEMAGLVGQGGGGGSV